MTIRTYSKHCNTVSTREPNSQIIDAQFLKHILDIVPHNRKKWNYELFFNNITPRFHWRFRTYYIDALPDNNDKNYHSIKTNIDSIERIERVLVKKGHIGKQRGHDIKTNQFCELRVQKQVDVYVSTELTRIAWSGESKHITLVTGDADFIPAIKAAKNSGSIVRLYYANYHCQRTGKKISTSQRLIDAVDEAHNIVPIIKKMCPERKKRL